MRGRLEGHSMHKKLHGEGRCEVVVMEGMGEGEVEKVRGKA